MQRRPRISGEIGAAAPSSHLGENRGCSAVLASRGKWSGGGGTAGRASGTQWLQRCPGAQKEQRRPCMAGKQGRKRHPRRTGVKRLGERHPRSSSDRMALGKKVQWVAARMVPCVEEGWGAARPEWVP